MAPNNCIGFKINGKIVYGLVHDIIYVNIPGDRVHQLVHIGRIENQFCKGMRRGVPIFCYWLYQMKTAIGQLIPNEYDLIPVLAIEHVVE